MSLLHLVASAQVNGSEVKEAFVHNHDHNADTIAMGAFCRLGLELVKDNEITGYVEMRIEPAIRAKSVVPLDQSRAMYESWLRNLKPQGFATAFSFPSTQVLPLVTCEPSMALSTCLATCSCIRTQPRSSLELPHVSWLFAKS